jgi:DNA-binding IclR family transcriptional regulator
VSSVDNALTLLAALRDHPSLAVKEGAELLGVAPSTAHRLLSTLQAHGFVSQEPGTRRYAAGPRLLEVALSSLERVDVRRVARPHLVALAAEVRETISLVVAEGDQVRFIDSAEGPELVRVANRTGDVLPAHLTSAGKVMLAGFSEAELSRVYPDERLLGITEGSTRSRSQLFAELEQVRVAGYATSFEQSSMGLSSVGVPITDLHGNVLAAIAVSVPASRLDEHRVGKIASAAERRAHRIEDELHEQARTQVAVDRRVTAPPAARGSARRWR